MSIFVSYSRFDETVVKELTSGLEAADRVVWFDNDLGGGDLWWVKILESIRQADVFIFGLSDHSLGSKPCRAELVYAVELNRAILPIKVGAVANLLANPLAAIQTLEFRPERALTAFEIIGAVDDALRRTLPLPDPLPAEPKMPYEYLVQLSNQIDTEELSPQVQIGAVDQLRKAFREEDVTVHATIKAILQRLKSKPWTTVPAANEIEDLLESVDRQEQKARARGTTPGGEGSGLGRPAAPPDGGGRSTGPTRAGPASTEAPEEDTRQHQFEQRLADLIESEQKKSHVRREEHKRAAAARSTARAATVGQRPPQAQPVTEGQQPNTSPGGGGASATPHHRPGGTGAGAAPQPFQLTEPALWPTGGWSGPAPQARPFTVTAPQGQAHQPSQTRPAGQATAGSWAGVSSSAARPQPTSGSPPPRPNWAWCIVALPTVVFGIVALYWAAQVNPRLTRGDLVGARRASAYARGWGIAGLIGLGIVLVVAVLAYFG